MIRVGKTTFSIEGIKSLTKDEFLELNKHINADLAQIWDDVNGTSSESNKAVGEKRKSNNSKKVDGVPFPKRGVQKANNRPKHD